MSRLTSRIFALVLFIVCVFVLAGNCKVFAQSQYFQFQSAADGLLAQYDQIPAGSNSYLSAYGTFSGHSSTGTCVPASTTCRNLRIEITKCLAFSGSVCTNEVVLDAKLAYVSSTQINFITPVVPTQYPDYRIDVIRDDTSAIVSTGIELQENGTYDYSAYVFAFQPNNMRLFTESRTINGTSYGLLRGTLYGCTSAAVPCPGYVALKSLSDGVANQRNYNGHPTLIQAYVTGATSLSGSVQFCTINSNGTIPIAGEYSTGVQLINLTTNWESGVNEISFFYSGQNNQHFAYLYWQ